MQSEVRGNWIPLVDYSFKTGISLSTLRRHIKTNKILYRLEDGRYLIYDADASGTPLTNPNATLQNAPSGATYDSQPGHSDSKTFALAERVHELESELQKANEEITELKMLLALYEEKIGPSA